MKDNNCGYKKSLLFALWTFISPRGLDFAVVAQKERYEDCRFREYHCHRQTYACRLLSAVVRTLSRHRPSIGAFGTHNEPYLHNHQAKHNRTRPPRTYPSLQHSGDTLATAFYTQRATLSPYGHRLLRPTIGSYSRNTGCFGVLIISEKWEMSNSCSP